MSLKVKYREFRKA